MSAPDRIWATPFDRDLDCGTYCDAVSRPTAPNGDTHLYLRRDGETVTALVEALQRAERSLDDAALKIADLENTLSDYRNDWGPAQDAAGHARAALAKLEGL